MDRRISMASRLDLVLRPDHEGLQELNLNDLSDKHKQLGSNDGSLEDAVRAAVGKAVTRRGTASSHLATFCLWTHWQGHVYL